MVARWLASRSMIWRRRCLAVSAGADVLAEGVLMNKYLRFDFAQVRRRTIAGAVLSERSESKGTHYICSRFDTVALRLGKNGSDQCLPIPRSVVESLGRPATVIGQRLSEKVGGVIWPP